MTNQEIYNLKRAFYVVSMELAQRIARGSLDDETSAAMDFGMAQASDPNIMFDKGCSVEAPKGRV